MSNRIVYERKGIRSVLTQGSIINHCISESYPDTLVWGLIITPRCDLAHDGKVSTLHYLPMVTLSNWMSKFGSRQIIDNLLNDTRSSVNNIYKSLGVSFNIVEQNFSSDELLRIATKKKLKGKQLETLKKALAILDKEEHILSDFDEKSVAKKLERLRDDLVNNKFKDFYCIERWPNPSLEIINSLDNEMVVSLREIRRIPIHIGSRFSQGFFKSDYDNHELALCDLSCSGNDDDVFAVEAIIKSPFIEHIMQAFNYNFCRIGVDDSGAERNNAILQGLNSTINKRTTK